MILQALTQYYDALNARGEIDAPGWGRPKISYALQLRENGELAQVIPLLHEVDAGKKKVLRPREDIRLPAAVKRSSGVTSNFMWDNSASAWHRRKRQTGTQSAMLSRRRRAAPQAVRQCGLSCRTRNSLLL